MPSSKKRISLVLFAGFLVATIFSSSAAQATFLDTIRALVTINPLRVSVSAPTGVEIGETFKLEARVTNRGAEKIENVRAEIFLPEKLVLLKKNAVREAGVIRGKREKKISWQVRGEQTGNYVISVKASATLREAAIIAEGSVLVRITEKSPPGRRNIFEFLQDLFNFFRR